MKLFAAFGVVAVLVQLAIYAGVAYVIYAVLNHYGII